MEKEGSIDKCPQTKLARVDFFPFLIKAKSYYLKISNINKISISCKFLNAIFFTSIFYYYLTEVHF